MELLLGMLMITAQIPPENPTVIHTIISTRITSEILLEFSGNICRKIICNFFRDSRCDQGMLPLFIQKSILESIRKFC